MDAIEHTKTNLSLPLPVEVAANESIVSRVLRLFSSVRFGVTLLALLIMACMIGMLIVQQNVDGFERYFAGLTPAERLVFGKLGFFDIYHSWYFNAILAALSMNIILASLDRFPITWQYAAKPAVAVPLRWLREQTGAAEFQDSGDRENFAANIRSQLIIAGWRSTATTSKDGALYVFAQSGLWNRFSAYAVHFALLTIFFGGFLTSQMGSFGQMTVRPGETMDLITATVVELDQAKKLTKKLPFEIEGVDIQQRLVKKDGPITAANTIDWITKFTIRDGSETHEASTQLNRPYDYRGYRFFQADFTNIGRARSIVLRLTPVDGGETVDLTIPRNGVTVLPNATTVAFSEFRGDFQIGDEGPDQDTASYRNPAAILRVTRPGNPPETAYAFGQQMSASQVASKAIAGYTFRLVDFEKAADAHVLAVQWDPGANVVYVGFALLAGTLMSVFFFSHQRVWAAITERDDKVLEVIIAGNTNRNQNTFEAKIGKLVEKVRSQSRVAGER